MKVMFEKKLKNVKEIHCFKKHNYSFYSIKPLLIRLFCGSAYLLMGIHVGGKKYLCKGYTDTRVSLYTGLTIFNISWKETKTKTDFDIVAEFSWNS